MRDIIDRDQEVTIEEGSMAKAFMANVFSYMVLALAISGVMAWWFGTTEMIEYIIGPQGGFTALGWVTLLSPFAFILAMNFGLQKFSVPVLMLIFIAFATMLGISLSTIFLRYDLGVIYLTFGITAGTFGTMAVLGYTTSTDLTKFGSILYMALIGLIIAMVVNWFVGSDAIDYLISCIGVLIFTGLTAYDTQKLKRIGAGVEYGSDMSSKLAIMGATTLYLDFVNLFLFLLRIIGGRD
ncbi:Bax inhibitor-1/YccA family protein [Halocola ammonii]